MKKIGLVGLKTIRLEKTKYEEVQIKALSHMPQMDCVVMHVDVLKRIMVSKYAELPIIVYVDEHYNEFDTLNQYPVVNVMTSSMTKDVRDYIIQLTLRSKQVEKKLKQAQVLLSKVQQNDFLTNIYTKQVVIERLQEEIMKNQRYGEDIGISLIEIDNFQAVNDRIGRLNGDILIQNVSQLIESELRKSDYIGRYDDHSFLVVLPHTHSYGALVFAERVRSMIELKEQQLNHQNLKITVSTGVTTIRSNDENPETILDRCTKALNEAKDKGSNQVIIH